MRCSDYPRGCSGGSGCWCWVRAYAFRSGGVVPGAAAYSDLSLARGGTVLGFLFERDNYRHVSFGTTPLASFNDGAET